MELREYTTDMPRLFRESILLHKGFVPGGANTTKSGGGASEGRVDESVSLSSPPSLLSVLFSLSVSCLALSCVPPKSSVALSCLKSVAMLVNCELTGWGKQTSSEDIPDSSGLN